MPTKWLAIESINFQIFTKFSDVWSFGVVLWELFSLGKEPYPGIDGDEFLCKRINNGYRMEKPEYATQEMQVNEQKKICDQNVNNELNLCSYEIMRSCWCLYPKNRPSFNELELIISALQNNALCMRMQNTSTSIQVDSTTNEPPTYDAAQMNISDAHVIDQAQEIPMQQL